MLKPVTILSLDPASAVLAAAVQQRVAAIHGLDDLVQARDLGSGATVAEAIQSIHAQRQRPDSALRLRDDVSTRELVLLIACAAGEGAETLLATASHIRELYEMRRLASYFTIEILCLLPEVAGESAADYARAYALLKALSGADPKPFNEVWLVDASNASRVKFGALDAAAHVYADAIAGALTFEAEMSGALPGLHPRGMPPVFSAFGYAELVFPRDAALQRLEPRFAAELIRGRLLQDDGVVHARLAAKQFIVGDPFAIPLSRIGRDAGQSLFQRFQPRTQVTKNTRSADELIAAVRGELAAHRDSRHMQNLEAVARQGDESAGELEGLTRRAIEETLDRNGYRAAISLAEALLDPMPDVHADGDAAPRNLITEINTATSAFDARLGLVPNVVASTAARKRVRELDQLLEDQTLVADTVDSASASERLAEMAQEKITLMRRLPELLFAEESENNGARTTARETETARLAAESSAREQTLRELMAQRPRAQQALREALEERRTWLWRQVLAATLGVSALYGIAFALDLLRPNFARITQAAITALSIFGAYAAFRYFTRIAPLVRNAREGLSRLHAQIEAADKAKNVAYNDELSFEYDLAHRRATLNVLRRVRDVAKQVLEAMRNRMRELEELVASFAFPSIASGGLTISIIDDEDLDRWYERTTDDRKPFLRELPLTRSESLRLPLEALRSRLTAYAGSAFGSFRTLTLAGATVTLTPEAKLTHRLKRFVDVSAPLVELRDDDLPAQQAMQRDATVWIESTDAVWLAQIQRRFPEAQVKAAPDPLRVHALTRVLHFPGYILGQIDYYRAQYEAAPNRIGVDAPDLVPMERALPAAVRAAYEQVLLGRAVGVVDVRADGKVLAQDVILGDSHLAAAQRLAASDGAPLRERLDVALEPRLAVAGDVERDLGRLLASVPLSALERTIVGVLTKRYASVF